MDHPHRSYNVLFHPKNSMKDSPNHLSALAKVQAEQREVSWTGRMESKVFIFPSLVMGANLLNEMPQNQRKCSVHPWVLGGITGLYHHDNFTKNDGSSPTGPAFGFSLQPPPFSYRSVLASGSIG